MKGKNLSIAAILTFVVAATLYAQKISFDFTDQKFGDILFALSTYKGISIVGDDTVTGTASFQFAGSDFDRAFDSFLLMNRLYVGKTDRLWTVSRILVSGNSADDNLSIDALDVPPAQILERLSRYSGTTILFDVLPASRISIHIASGTVADIASLVMKPFTGFTVEKTPTHLHVRRIPEGNSNQANTAQLAVPPNRLLIERSGESWTVQVGQARLSEILDRVCREEKTSYSNFIKNDPVLSGISVSGNDFGKTLEIILEQAGGETFIKEGIRYFVPAAASDTAKKLRDGMLIWKEYALANLRFRDAQPLLAARFPGLQTSALPDTKRFLAGVDGKTDGELSDWLAMTDVPAENGIFKLKYLTTAEFLKSLPPSVRKEELTDTGTGDSFFYAGPAGAAQRLAEELKEMDRPKKRIRYDMLIIQYEKSSNLAWNPDAEARLLKPGDMTSAGGNFGSLLNLNFDVITLFGYRFSARLDTALAENKAQVFTDTTLQGISGENIKFQNTSTYRYRDSNIDPETGKPVLTGVTREIVSGVMLELNGWVSGDGMVTMNIHASVSKRGADVSGLSANPPPTSEKSITTKLSTADGEPVILSGLTQNDSMIAEQRIPFISRIPLLGWLFRARNASTEKTEMVIYIVPHINTEIPEGVWPGTVGENPENTALDRLIPGGSLQ